MVQLVGRAAGLKMVELTVDNKRASELLLAGDEVDAGVRMT
jgi:hypothetical protein